MDHGNSFANGQNNSQGSAIFRDWQMQQVRQAQADIWKVGLEPGLVF